MSSGPAPSLPPLSDGVVRLRPFADEDAPALVEIWRDLEIRERNEVPEPDEDSARDWVAAVAARAAAEEAWEWAVIDASSGALAGRRALKEIDWRRKRAVTACWIAPGFRGRRFAARSLRLAAEQGFANGIVRLHAECDVDNEASRRSVLTAGMRYEGTLRACHVSGGGVPVDQHVFGMLAEDLPGAPPIPAEDEPGT